MKTLLKIFASTVGIIVGVPVLALGILFIYLVISFENRRYVSERADCDFFAFHSQKFCFSKDDPKYRLTKIWHKDSRTLTANFDFWPDGPGTKKYLISLDAELTESERQEPRHQVPWSDERLRGQVTTPEDHLESLLSLGSSLSNEGHRPHELPLDIRNEYWSVIEDIPEVSRGYGIALKDITDLIQFERPHPTFIGIRSGRIVHLVRAKEYRTTYGWSIDVDSQRPSDRYSISLGCGWQVEEAHQAASKCTEISDMFRDIVKEAIARASVDNP